LNVQVYINELDRWVVIFSSCRGILVSICMGECDIEMIGHQVLFICYWSLYCIAIGLFKISLLS